MGQDATDTDPTTVLVATRHLLRADALCPRCRDWIVATADPDGIWVKCACDAGYAAPRIRVILP